MEVSRLVGSRPGARHALAASASAEWTWVSVWFGGGLEEAFSTGARWSVVTYIIHAPPISRGKEVKGTEPRALERQGSTMGQVGEVLANNDAAFAALIHRTGTVSPGFGRFRRE